MGAPGAPGNTQGGLPGPGRAIPGGHGRDSYRTLRGGEHVVAQLDHAVVESLFIAQREVETVVRQKSQPTAKRHRAQQDVDLIDQDRKSTRLYSSHVAISFAVY